MIKACLAGCDAQFCSVASLGKRVSKIVEHRGRRKVRRSRFFEREAESIIRASCEGENWDCLSRCSLCFELINSFFHYLISQTLQLVYCF